MNWCPRERWPGVVLRGMVAVSSGLLVPLVVRGQADAQPAQPPHKVMEQSATDCTSCHTCAAPTSEKNCLPACTRDTPEAIGDEFGPGLGPELVILDRLAGQYLPVPFDHAGHAKMAAMTRGCRICHHNSPRGADPPPCASCHEVAPAQADIRKPGLKGAYHRQCLNCHREWSGETRCGVCHPAKTRAARRTNVRVVPTKDDLIGLKHTPITRPDVKVFRAEREGHPRSEVLFRHTEHIERYGLRCAECHFEDTCARCHGQGQELPRRSLPLPEHHRRCRRCHEEASFKRADAACDRCHYQKGEPAPAPFDHARTGWALNRPHRTAGCRSCHTGVPFTRLDRTCRSCHEPWSPDSFDHTVTGQVLDDNHDGADCTDCHIDGDFGAAPACGECHDEEDGITFPSKRPGPLLGP